MTKTFRITIPKIEIGIKIEEIKDEHKENKKEEISDYYFVTLHNDILHKNITILTVQDILTIGIFSLDKIKHYDLTEDTLCGFNTIIPGNKTVFFSRVFEDVKNKIISERIRILNDLSKYSKKLFKSSIIDICSLYSTHVLWSYNLSMGKEVKNV